MSREEWRNKIAEVVNEAWMAGAHDAEYVAADAVLALLETEGRILWWCEGNQMAVGNVDCRRRPHRRVVCIELEGP